MSINGPGAGLLTDSTDWQEESSAFSSFFCWELPEPTVSQV